MLYKMMNIIMDINNPALRSLTENLQVKTERYSGRERGDDSELSEGSIDDPIKLQEATT